MVAPLVVPVPAVVGLLHALTLPPVIDQVTPLLRERSLGVVAPATPLTTAVKVMVDPGDVPPLEVRIAVGVALAITTLVAGVEETLE